MYFFTLQMVHNCSLRFCKKPHIQEKSGYSILVWNALSQSDCSILWVLISLEGINRFLRIFFYVEIIIKKGSILHYRSWLGVASCTSRPIRLLDSLTINIPGMSQVISWIFCMEINQRKLASKITTFGWVWPVVHLIQSYCRIWSLMEEIQQSHRFFAWS